VWTQQGSKLLGSPQFDNSGASVAISADGNTALVGQVSFAGGALAYTRSDGVWTQQGPQLSVATSDGESYSVYAVALSGDGNTALIGTTAYAGNWPGAAWIFARTGGQWLQAGGKLLSSGAIGSLTRQGRSAALSPGGEYGLVGDPGDNDGAGAAWLFAISRKPVPSLSVSSSAKLATYAAQPTFMVRVVGDVSSGAPTGTVSILVDDFVQSQAAALLDGAASLTASIPPGDHSVRFAYSGDAIYSAITSAALTQTINHGPTSTTLTATPSYTAGLLRLSSHVNGPDAAARINDGATTFRDAAGKVLGSPVTLGGDAHWDVSLASLTTPAAIYRFTASYDGSSDANRTYDPSPLSIPATFTTGGNTVTVRLTSSANPAVFGEPVTITATVVPPAGRPMPTGTVGFFDNSTRYSSLATGGALAPLNKSGQASMTAPFDAGLSNRTIVLLGGGTHVISATYFGDANYSATPFAQDGPAATVNQQIARADTTTALRTGYGPDGRSSFIAGVSPIAEFPSARAVLDPDGKLLNGYPAGAVQFWKDNTLIGAASIHQASVPSFASLSASTPLGNIRAVYTGDSNYNGSSDPAPLSPPPSPRTVILTADPISPTTLQPVTFTATVEAVSGTVQFFDGRAPLGTAPVVRGQARFTTFLRAGAHSIGAAYNGNPDYPAPSATIGMYVTQPRP
jgi:Bacterial Ig-like domain (group 3)